MMGQLIGTSVELSVGQVRSFERDGDLVGRAFGLLLEQLMETFVSRIPGLSIIELDQELLSLRSAQNLQFADRGFRIVGNTFQ